MLAATRQRFLDRLREDPPRRRPRLAGRRLLPRAPLPRCHRTPAGSMDHSRAQLSLPRAARAACHRNAASPARCASPIWAQGTAGSRTGSRCAAIAPSRSTFWATRWMASPQGATIRSARRSRASTRSSTTLPLADRQPRSGDLQRVHPLLRRTTGARSAKSAAACVPAGSFLIVDSPVYQRREHGEMMRARTPPAIREDLRLRLRHAAEHRVFRSRRCSRELGRDLGIAWKIYRPWYGWQWALRPWKARWKRQTPAFQFLDSGAAGSRMIILFHPRSTKPKNRRLPLSVLYLGAVLEGREEYEIVDGNADPDPWATIDGLVQQHRWNCSASR